MVRTAIRLFLILMVSLPVAIAFAEAPEGLGELELTANWREWTDREGRVVVARFRAVNEGAGLMEFRYGEVYLVDLEIFSSGDRVYLRRLLQEGLVPRLRSADEIIGEVARKLSQNFKYALPRSINQYVKDLPEVIDAQRRTDLAPREKYFEERDRLRRTIIAAENEYDRFFRAFLEPVGAFIGINNSYGPTGIELSYLHGLEFLGKFEDPSNRRRCLRFLKQQPGYQKYVGDVLNEALSQSEYMADQSEMNAFRSRLQRGGAALNSIFSDETALSHDELRELAWLLDEVINWNAENEDALKRK